MITSVSVFKINPRSFAFSRGFQFVGRTADGRGWGKQGGEFYIGLFAVLRALARPPIAPLCETVLGVPPVNEFSKRMALVLARHSYLFAPEWRSPWIHPPFSVPRSLQSLSSSICSRARCFVVGSMPNDALRRPGPASSSPITATTRRVTTCARSTGISTGG